MTPLAEKVKNDILGALENDELVLPTLPEVALKAREAAEDPDISAGQLAKVIANDTALCARVIKVANSPLLRATKPVDDIQMAISRIGITYAANLITGLAMEQMFQATTDMVDKRLRESWHHSTEVAGIAQVLCRHYARNLKPDHAALAGLVHEIGILPILTYAEEHPAILRDAVTLNEVIDAVHPYIGEKILESWDFPSDITQVPLDYLDFSREAAEKPTYSDVVTVANLQSYHGKDHPLTQIDWHQVHAFEAIGLDPDIEQAEGEDLSADMEAAMAMLH